jgi:hypothetical protein
MNKFVSIEGYPDQFFMVVSKPEDLPNGIEDKMQKRLETVCADEWVSDKKDSSFSKFQFAAMNTPNYEAMLHKHPGWTMLIRQIGSYMYLNDDHKITQTIFSEDFPRNTEATIVVCENASVPEPEWIKYLEARFPGEKIEVLNFFSTRSVEELTKLFKTTKYITFSTTFSSTEWFDNIIKSKTGENVIIGYCHTPEMWDKIKTDYPGENFEIVNSLNTNI